MLDSVQPILQGDYNNILKIVYNQIAPEDDEIINGKFFSFIQQRAPKLRKSFIRRVTILVTMYGSFPRCFTFRERLGYQEHMIYRHVEPPLAYHLELSRLSNYDVEMWSSGKLLMLKVWIFCSKNTPLLT
jgi:acetyl-CoA carboxylase/biotin carboxylase 1